MPLLFRVQMTCLGDKALLHHKVSNVVRAIGAEAEAHQALSAVIDEFILLQKGSELLQNLREGGCGIHLLLFAVQTSGGGRTEDSSLVRLRTRDRPN